MQNRLTTSTHVRRVFGLAALSLGVALVVVACNSNNPTSPYGGGNNGGNGTGGNNGGTSFNLGPFALGQSAVFTFANAGTFGYHCITHRALGMVGTVQVDTSGADSALVQVGASGYTFTPSTAHIKPGGHVRWVNASGMTDHTVTSN
jgi:plastocyanin